MREQKRVLIVYKVMVVEDHELPESFDWAWVRTRTPERARLMVKRSLFGDPEWCCERLSAAWAARVSVEGDPQQVLLRAV